MSARASLGLTLAGPGGGVCIQCSMAPPPSAASARTPTTTYRQGLAPVGTVWVINEVCPTACIAVPLFPRDGTNTLDPKVGAAIPDPSLRRDRSLRISRADW